ncbi:hypothetical protein HanIR_Chr14g0697151 [Helianthus annuus]|nr:hypothetical protein HanIR_Chr14g0697151 [Helianthus annuus]
MLITRCLQSAIQFPGVHNLCNSSSIVNITVSSYKLGHDSRHKLNKVIHHRLLIVFTFSN